MVPFLEKTEFKLKDELPFNKKDGVIYTCITGDYDSLINHTCINHDWDYVCFTDNKHLSENRDSLWEIRPILFDSLDDVRNQRWHKLHPHILFPEYQKSIWLDGNVNVNKKDFFEDISGIIAKKLKISIPIHPGRDCIYDELQECLQLRKDDPETMRKQIDIIRNDGFPKKYGLFETNVIYREHHDRDVVKLMEDWWQWIANHSRRDQLSLTYVLWKNAYSIFPLRKTSYRKGDTLLFECGENHVTKEELIAQKKNLQNILNQTVVERDGQIAALNQTIIEKEGMIAALNQTVVERGGQIATLNQTIIAREEEFVRLTSSNSWRITLPLREIRRWFSAPKHQAKRYIQCLSSLAKALVREDSLDGDEK